MTTVRGDTQNFINFTTDGLLNVLYLIVIVIMKGIVIISLVSVFLL